MFKKIEHEDGVHHDKVHLPLSIHNQLFIVCLVLKREELFNDCIWLCCRRDNKLMGCLFHNGC